MKHVAIGIALGAPGDPVAVAAVERIGPSDQPPDQAEYRLLWLEDFRPTTFYQNIAGAVTQILEHPTISDPIFMNTGGETKWVEPSVFIVVDTTVAGPLIANFLEQKIGRTVSRAVLGARNTEHISDGVYAIHRQDLITNLVVALQQKCLRIPKTLEKAEELCKALHDYGNRKTANAHVTNLWRVEPQDHLIFAVGLAVLRLWSTPGRFEWHWLW